MTTEVINIESPLGPDTFTLLLYDQKQKSGEALPVGNLVGEAEVAHTILPNRVNTVRASIAGVVSQVEISTALDEAFVTADRQIDQFDLIGQVPAEFRVTAEDMDGNVIVPQPKTLNLRALSPNYLRVTRLHFAKSLQRFLVTPLSTLPTGSTVGLEASATDAWGDAAQTSVAVTESPAIYVAYAGVPNGSTPIVVYSAKSGASLRLRSEAFAGLGSISALAYDYADRRLLVGDTTNGAVSAFDGAGSKASGFRPIQVLDTKAIAYDNANSNIYVNGNVDGVLGISAYSNTGAPITLEQPAFRGINPGGPLASIASSGELVEGQSAGGGAVGEFSATGAPESTLSVPVSEILGLATDYVSSGSGSNGRMDVFVIGTPRAGGFANLFDAIPGTSLVELAALNDPRAIAQDPNSADLYVASGATGDVIPLTYLSWSRGTPIRAAAGYSNPTAIVIVP